jgi:hypothetical protein
MRNIYTLVIALILTVNSWAQAPQKMSYQAVIRNNSNTLISSAPVGMRVSILQFSTTGTEVYKEIYNPNPQTNTNGLVTLEIGSGIPIIGTFASIVWANGPYFIKTETDPTGGTNYSIVGISQLLSVPYALHSKTAENITGAITETDPVFGAWDKSSGINITESQISDLQNYLTSENDGSVTNEIEMPSANAGDMAYYNGTNWTKVLAGNNNQVLTFCDGVPIWTNNGQCPLQIGDSYAGGIIFYLDGTGQHGLVCAPSDQSTGAPWGCKGTFINGADNTSIGSGNQNTTDIITDCTTSGIAAKICFDLILNGHSDWFLPSKDELVLMYTNLKTAGLGGFANTWYWASTEDIYFDYAWHCYFNNGNATTAIGGYPDKNTLGYVRAVRAF